MALDGQGQGGGAAGGAAAGRRASTLESQGLDFTRLHAYYPPLDRTAGAVLRGPFSIEAKGQRQGGTGQGRQMGGWTPGWI